MMHLPDQPAPGRKSNRPVTTVVEPAPLLRRPVLWWCSLFILLALLLPARPLSARPGWRFHGLVAQGGQIDAQSGADGTIHLVSSRYYQFDRQGRLLLDEPVGDGRQGAMDFPPALAVDAEGGVHLLTRHDGSWSSGLALRYRRRSAAGTWDRDMALEPRAPRNYVVGIGVAGPDRLFMLSGRQVANVWGNIVLWQQEGGSVLPEGELTDIWRVDTDARMRAGNDRIFLVSGRCDGDGSVYFTHCRPDSDCITEMRANLRVHRGGSGRRGMPDIAIDGLGQGHLTYGADQEVYYNRYDASQRPVFARDRKIFSDLGTWHLSIGLSAVAASADGSRVLAVALRSDGSKEAGNSELLWSWSADGGATWSTPRSMGVRTDGGEGRRRPRLVAVDSTFFLFYADREARGISMASIDLEQDSGPPAINGALHLLLDG